jgi:hypothetical protein
MCLYAIGKAPDVLSAREQGLQKRADRKQEPDDRDEVQRDRDVGQRVR